MGAMTMRREKRKWWKRKKAGQREFGAMMSVSRLSPDG
jgi:hypothetical protein